jgi:AcrR family transcriptional regulator
MMRQPEQTAVEGALSCHATDLPSWADARAEALRVERRDAAENRERILATAQSLFSERGVEAVTMQEIARVAGVGQGTLYRRYPHKGALCQALLDESMYAFYHDLATLSTGEDASPSALAQLDAFFTRLIALNEQNSALLSAMMDAASGERRNEWYECPIYRWLHQAVAALLRRAVDAQEIPPLDIDCTADALLAPCDIEVYLFQRHSRGFTPERIAAGLRRLVVGLRAA